MLATFIMVVQLQDNGADNIVQTGTQAAAGDQGAAQFAGVEIDLFSGDPPARKPGGVFPSSMWNFSSSGWISTSTLSSSEVNVERATSPDASGERILAFPGSKFGYR
jgi:hypothetical protein